jgi:hypothetical protein
MWILASRGRPESIIRFIDRWNLTLADSKVYLRLDDCDERLAEYKQLKYPNNFEVVVGPRKRLVAASNEMFLRYPHETWYGLLADDLNPKTEHWDKKLINAAGSKYIAVANDLTSNPLKIYHPVVGGDLVRKAGWFGFPHTSHFCIELPWKYLSFHNKSLLKYLPDVIVEHVHYKYNKSNFDKTYSDSQSRRSQDIEIWKEWRKNHYNDFLKKMEEIV